MTVENQSLADEGVAAMVEQLVEDGMSQEDAEAMFSDSEDTSGGKDKKSSGKIHHAFAKIRKAKKESDAAREKLEAEKLELEERLKSSGSESTNVQTPDSGAAQAAQLLQALTLQSMQNLGVMDLSTATPQQVQLVEMERLRLYNDKVAQISKEKSLKDTAPRLVEERLAGIEMLEDSDRQEIKSRLSKYDVSQQADENVLNREVQILLGEKAMRGELSTGGNTDTSARDTQSVTANASAASAVKNGRAGVKPGKNQNSNQPKPPSSDELNKMKQLGMTDIKAFRAAQDRVAGYRTQ